MARDMPMPDAAFVPEVREAKANTLPGQGQAEPLSCLDLAAPDNGHETFQPTGSAIDRAPRKFQLPAYDPPRGSPAEAAFPLIAVRTGAAPRANGSRTLTPNTKKEGAG